MRFFVLIFILVLWAAPVAAQDKDGFHPPITDAEHDLDNILWRSDNDGNLDDYAFKFARRDRTNDREYAKLVTQEYRSSVAAFQKHLIQENCGGVDRHDAICGYDANPFSCGQDSWGARLYQTENETTSTANIIAIWKKQDPQYGYNKYRMVKVGERWKLDGVLCADDDNFNYGDK